MLFNTEATTMHHFIIIPRNQMLGPGDPGYPYIWDGYDGSRSSNEWEATWRVFSGNQMGGPGDNLNINPLAHTA